MSGFVATRIRETNGMVATALEIAQSLIGTLETAKRSQEIVEKTRQKLWSPIRESIY